MFFPLDYVIDRTLEKSLSREQWLLNELTGKRFGPTESRMIWKRVVDHKWYVSERLGRDIGLKVAAIDFVENLYEHRGQDRRPRKSLGILFGSAGRATIAT